MVHSYRLGFATNSLCSVRYLPLSEEMAQVVRQDFLVAPLRGSSMCCLLPERMDVLIVLYRFLRGFAHRIRPS